MDRNRVKHATEVESSASQGAGLLELWHGAGQVVWHHAGVCLYGLLRTSVRERGPWAFIASIFLSVRWDAAIDRGGEWFSFTRENTGVWAEDHQGRHAMAA